MNAPFQAYLEPAAARPQFWRLLVGLALIVAVWVAWTVLAMIGAVLAIAGPELMQAISDGARGGDMGQRLAQIVADALAQTESLTSTGSADAILFQLITFAGIWPGAWLALKLLHKRPFLSLISPELRMRWGEFGWGLALAGVVVGLSLAVAILTHGLPARSAMTMDRWLPAVLPLLPLVFLQASGEELIFRGYVLQQLAVRFRAPIVWGFLPAFLFGIIHYQNGEPLGAGIHYVVVTTLFGLTAAALVWRTGSLALVMGLHTGMNSFSLSVVGIEGLFEGLQLFLYPVEEAPMLLVADGVGTFLLLLFILSPWFPPARRAGMAEPATVTVRRD